MIMPVITVVTLMVTKILEGNLKAIPRKHSIDSLKINTAVPGTSDITRQVLQSET